MRAVEENQKVADAAVFGRRVAICSRAVGDLVAMRGPSESGVRGKAERRFY